jgi:hypothetical protein
MSGLIVVVLAGCADPMRYAAPIATMRAGTEQVAGVVGASMAHVEADPGAQWQFCLVAAAAAGVPLQTASADALGDAPAGPCAVTWREARDEERVASAAIWTRHDTVHALTDYVRALEALMKADDAALEDAGQTLAHAVGALFEAAARLPGNGALPGARQAAAGVEDLLAGLSTDYARLATLRDAVVAADPVVSRFVALVAADVEVAHALRTGRAPVEFARARPGTVMPVRTDGGQQVLELPSAVAAFRASDPAGAVQRLGIAHAALVRAVTDDTSRSFIELTFAVDQFAQAAHEVWQAYGAYTEALARSG